MSSRECDCGMTDEFLTELVVAALPTREIMIITHTLNFGKIVLDKIMYNCEVRNIEYTPRNYIEIGIEESIIKLKATFMDMGGNRPQLLILFKIIDPHYFYWKNGKKMEYLGRLREWLSYRVMNAAANGVIIGFSRLENGIKRELEKLYLETKPPQVFQYVGPASRYTDTRREA